MILTIEALDTIVEIRVVSILCEKLLSKQIDTIRYVNEETGEVIDNMKVSPRIIDSFDSEAKINANEVNVLIMENDSTESKRSYKIEALTQLFSEGLVSNELFLTAYQKYETEN